MSAGGLPSKASLIRGAKLTAGVGSHAPNGRCEGNLSVRTTEARLRKRSPLALDRKSRQSPARRVWEKHSRDPSTVCSPSVAGRRPSESRTRALCCTPRKARGRRAVGASLRSVLARGRRPTSGDRTPRRAASRSTRRRPWSVFVRYEPGARSGTRTPATASMTGPGRG